MHPILLHVIYPFNARVKTCDGFEFITIKTNQKVISIFYGFLTFFITCLRMPIYRSLSFGRVNRLTILNPFFFRVQMGILFGTGTFYAVSYYYKTQLIEGRKKWVSQNIQNPSPTQGSRSPFF